MEVTVPMVGKLVKILVKEGDQVKENDQIAIIEAMKMEMPIVAPISGTVKEIKIKEGQQVTSDTVIMIIE